MTYCITVRMAAYLSDVMDSLIQSMPRCYTREEIENVIRNDDEQFSLKMINDIWMVRSNYGHTLNNTDSTESTGKTSYKTYDSALSSFTVQKDDAWDLKISKTLIFILRHGAERIGLKKIGADGFASVYDVFEKIWKQHDCTLQDIERVAKNDEKRFTLKAFNNISMLKANFGHSLKKINLPDLKPVIDIDCDIVKGISLNKYESIKMEGLSRNQRNHIILTKGFENACQHKSCPQVFIFINFEKARQDDIEFYDCGNGIIISPGDANGHIQAKYFFKILTRDGQVL